jgi:hypothetical protein
MSRWTELVPDRQYGAALIPMLGRMKMQPAKVWRARIIACQELTVDDEGTQAIQRTRLE